MEKLTARILTVGDELLVGQILDTNASYLAAELTRIGITVTHTLTVGDNQEAIETAIQDCMRQCSLTLVTGGLGPTVDDLTREAVAAMIGSTLKKNPSVLTSVERHFASLGRSVPIGSERVAMVPLGFEILPNPKGTAPGLWYMSEYGNAIVLLPGVPHEMKAIFSDYVSPRIIQMEGRASIAQRTLKVAGIGETVVQGKIETILHLLDPGLTIAYLPGAYGVRIRLTIRGADAEKRLDKTEKTIRNSFGPAIFGRDEDTLESVLGTLLSSQKKTIAIAESCTGGLVLNHLTNVPGSSSYVLGGVVAYSNLIKQRQLDVREETLNQFGAVSEPVAIQMATGVRARFGSDLGLSVTGIAGPDGGTVEKPVGLVWIAYADDCGAWAVKHLFGMDRHRNKQKSALAVLDLARQTLLKSSSFTHLNQT
ncbi:MAG: competence/damage-inducible protein A [Bacteroidetes bacterium]|nr:competence/damage-inducible protein A [Bacteroidota bacterium]